MRWSEFQSRYGGLTEEAFLGEVRTLHLVFPTQPGRGATVPFLTHRGARERVALSEAGGMSLRGLPQEEGRLISLGRSPGNDVMVRTGEISKVHCYFRRGPGRWEVKDAGSANGTVLNDQTISPEVWTPLSSADVLLVADFLEVHIFDPAALYLLLSDLGRQGQERVAQVDPRRPRKFLAVVDEGPLRDRLAQALSGLGSLHTSRLWSEVAPKIWSADAGDAVICTPDMDGLSPAEFCAIVARHKPEVSLFVLGSAPDLPSGVVELSAENFPTELRRCFAR